MSRKKDPNVSDLPPELRNVVGENLETWVPNDGKDCPAPELFDRLADETLPDTERKAIQSHLQDCPMCGMIAIDAMRTFASVRDLHRGWRGIVLARFGFLKETDAYMFRQHLAHCARCRRRVHRFCPEFCTESTSHSTASEQMRGATTIWSERRLIPFVMGAISAASLAGIIAIERIHTVQRQFDRERAINETQRGRAQQDAEHIVKQQKQLAELGRKNAVYTAQIEELRQEIRSAIPINPRRIATIRPALPSDLGKIAAQVVVLRGNGVDKTPEVNLLSPVAIFVDQNHPVFRWKPYEGATGYKIKVYDTTRSDSPPIIDRNLNQPLTAWRPSSKEAELHGGTIYRWQVTAHLTNGRPDVTSAPAKFKVLDTQAAADLHLKLGIAYASEGLLDEARQQFMAVPKGIPQYRTAQKLLHDLPTGVKR